MTNPTDAERERARELAEKIAKLLPDIKTFDGKLIVFDWEVDFARRVEGTLISALADAKREARLDEAKRFKTECCNTACELRCLCDDRIADLERGQ